MTESRLFLIFTIALFSAQAAVPLQEYGRTSAILTENDPDFRSCPVVLVYESGTVLYLLRRDNKPATWMIAHLSKSRSDSLRRSIGPTPDFLSLRAHYNLAPKTSERSGVAITLRVGDSMKTVEAYGYPPEAIPHLDPRLFKNPPPPPPMPDDLPPEFDRVYRLLTTFRYSDAVEWEPEWLEVMIFPYPYPYPAERSVAWPTGWPDLDDPLTFPLSDSGYSVILPGYLMADLTKLLSSRRKNQAFVINRRRWSAAFTYVMPNGSTWRTIQKVRDSLHK